MKKGKRIRRAISRLLINHLFCGTRFFQIKRRLLCFDDITCGNDVRLVGPIYFGGVSDIVIGNNVWIGYDFRIYGNGSVKIGSNIDIAPEVSVFTGSHKITDLSEHRAGTGISYSVNIGDGCWIGGRASIVGDVAIGKGTVIGACARVNKDVDNDVVAAGVPAKVIRDLNGKTSTKVRN